MKNISQSFKENIKEMGRELDSIISYNDGEEVIELGNSELNSVTPVFESSLLKSVMKELDIDSNVDIPLGTVINYKFGISLNGSPFEYIDFGDYIVYSSEKQEDTNSYNIVCYDRMLASMVTYEKLQTDIKTFPMSVRDYIDCICADLGLFFKNKDEEFANYNRIIQSDLYVELGYTYRDILDELAQVTASNIIINNNNELEIKYIEGVYEVAEASSDNSNVVIIDDEKVGYHKITVEDKNNLIKEIKVKYSTGYDTIDEQYLKDVNVAFGEKYGPINSIVLSRAAESDNVYLRDEKSVEENGLCEIKISENQIMNFNDRSDYLPDILDKLNGLEYYINDFSSTGICYYDVCDLYSVQVGGQVYKCVMFNDQINVTQGLEEIIFTDLPEQAETDYTKADKTDRRINQTYLIVDKQNQQIESVVSQVNKQNEKITQVVQTVDGIKQEVSSIVDVTTSRESNNCVVELDNIINGQVLELKVHPRGESISYLYPHNNLFPSISNIVGGLVPSNSLVTSNSLVPHIEVNGGTYSKVRTIRFYNVKTNEYFDYILPLDLLYYDSTNYDEFYYNYANKECYIIKRTEYDSNGNVVLLKCETKIDCEFTEIDLTEGDYIINILSYKNGYIYVKLPYKNSYSDIFATKVELKSSINQTAEKIELEVSNVSKMVDNEVQVLDSRITQTAGEINQEVRKKVGEDEIISKINQTPETITINASKLNLQGYITASDLSGSGSTTINGSNITTGTISADRVSGGTLQGTIISGNTIEGNTINGGTINGTTVSTTNGSIGGWNISSEGLNNGNIFIRNDGYSNVYTVADIFIIRAYLMGEQWCTMEPGSAEFRKYDLNGDGVINSSDLLLLRQMLNLQ